MDRQRQAEYKAELLQRAEYLEWTAEEWSDELTRRQVQIEGLKEQCHQMKKQLYGRQRMIQRTHDRAAR